MSSFIPKTLKGFILTAALLVSLVLFLGTYFVTMQVYNSAIKDNAITFSKSLAEETFNDMFQIMRRGWSRAELEEFLTSLHNTSEETPYSLKIFRGDIVSDLFGPISQTAMDNTVIETFNKGQPRTTETVEGIRYTYPLKARDECLRCHTNAQPDNVLGVIEVTHELKPLVDKGKSKLLLPLLLIAPLPFIVALLIALFMEKKLSTTLSSLSKKIDNIHKLSDLNRIAVKDIDLGFTEFNHIFEQVHSLGKKLQTVAVDKDLLEFEIRLLEKFVITSDVVRDWRKYICSLLVEIHPVLKAYTFFSAFKIDEELFDLEIFWVRPPSWETKATMERAIKELLLKSGNFDQLSLSNFNHNIAQPDADPIELGDTDISIQTKSIALDSRNIDGMVGIGISAATINEATYKLVIDSTLSTLLNLVASVKAIYKYTKDLEHYATRDPLTNLYNQRLFWEMLENEVHRAERHGYQFSLLVIDLDNFKSLNDSYGHSFGDHFLIAFSEAAQQALRTDDIFARYGGDEFVVILPETDQQDAQVIAERILDYINHHTLSDPHGNPVTTTVSIGTAVYPEHATDIKDLFMFADNMMYKAKAEGKNQVGIPSEHEVLEVFRNIGEKSIIISNAIEQKSIIPHFQPIMNVQNNELAAVEVLSRIQLENGEMLGAHEFIEISEKMGVINKLDQVVMENAFHTINENGYHGLIFLNLSPRSLMLSDLVNNTKSLAEKYNIPLGNIVFEITERDTVHNIESLEMNLRHLNSEGFKLAIDDFGSGFSSFHYLKRFPIDFVKIEGDFIRNMANDPRDAAFVKSIANLAHELKIDVIAEYVENEEVLDHVRGAGIKFAQGNFIGKPKNTPSCDLPIGNI